MFILPPNCIVPSATSLTMSPVFPSFLYFISILLVAALRESGAVDDALLRHIAPLGSGTTSVRPATTAGIPTSGWPGADLDSYGGFASRINGRDASCHGWHFVHLSLDWPVA